MSDTENTPYLRVLHLSEASYLLAQHPELKAGTFRVRRELYGNVFDFYVPAFEGWRELDEIFWQKTATGNIYSYDSMKGHLNKLAPEKEYGPKVVVATLDIIKGRSKDGVR